MVRPALLSLVLAVLSCVGLAEGHGESVRIVLPGEVTPERYAIELTPDAKALTFTGKVDITVTVRSPLDSITLNLANIEIGSVSLSAVEGVPTISLDKEREQATFKFKSPIAAGRHVLSIAYSGKILQQAAGLFAIDYDADEGPRRALFTQLEATHARKLVPSWDEPGLKAVFALTVVAPKSDLVVSNMPVAETAEAGGGKVRVRFADTPRMSTYLLFLAMGDLERKSVKVGGIDVGVVTRRGETDDAEFVLDAAGKLVAYYNDYFGVPYPLPKLDIVGIPGDSETFSGMENWGAISVTEGDLVLDPDLTAEADKQDAFVLAAHEIAHQWFGDLVTMAWWDDLWLNEGFASWMESKATDKFHPEWKLYLSAQDSVQGAIGVDARAGTHPVVTPIHDALEASTAFDEITYTKGQAVLSMIEAYVGEETFRKGVAAYIRKHAYQSAVSDDLWAELEAAAARPVRDIAHDFTLQAGVPLIRVDAVAGALRLAQGRFHLQDPAPPPQAWRVPVVVRGAGGEVWRGIVTVGPPALAEGVAAKGAIVNAGQVGYFRTAYAPALWASIAPTFDALPAADQLGLVHDSFALGLAGMVPPDDFLDLALRARPDAEPLVWSAIEDKLSRLDYYYEELPGQAAFRVFARKRLNAVLERLTWNVRPGEPDNDAVLRGVVLSALGQLADPPVIAEARRRFAALLADPETLKGSNRQNVLDIVAKQADAATWEQLHGLAKAATDPSDKSMLYALLGASRDPGLAAKALELALGEEAPVTIRPTIISAVAYQFPDEAFDFALAHRSAIEALVEDTARWTYLAELGGGSRKAATAQRLAAFAEASVPDSARGEFVKSIAAIRYRARIIATRLPLVDAWVASHGG